MATEESKQFFCWGEIVWEERCVREIYDPVHSGDKALVLRERLPCKGGGLTSMAVVRCICDN
jgi:hypothetical protein